jgi:hypothetical protein
MKIDPDRPQLTMPIFATLRRTEGRSARRSRRWLSALREMRQLVAAQAQ